MKTLEKALWATGGLGLVVGTAFSSANQDPTQVFDKTKQATIVEITDQTQGPGSYVNGLFMADPVIPAHLNLEQCPDQNPVLKKCKEYSLTITDEQVADFVIGQVVVVEELTTDY